MNHRITSPTRLMAPDQGGGTGTAPRSVRFALIGDYGAQNGDFRGEGGVPVFVKGWEPDFIVSLGDNAYSNHSETQNAFKVDVLDYYGEFIQSNAADPDGTRTRFFPTLGNHDYNASGSGVLPARVTAYEETFAVPSGPGGHHYYQFARGPVRFFVLNSNIVSGWKGASTGSEQDIWFRQALQDAKETYKIAIFHHSPYNSSNDNPRDTWMRAWRFEKTNLTAVIAGHAHVYERVMLGGFPFITNGVGGSNMSTVRDPVIDGSAFHYDRTDIKSEAVGNYSRGAILGEAGDTGLTLEFWTAGGKRLDRWPTDAAPLSRTPRAAP